MGLSFLLLVSGSANSRKQLHISRMSNICSHPIYMKELLNLTDHHYKAFLNKLLRILSANIATVLCGLHEVCQKGQFNLEGISIV